MNEAKQFLQLANHPIKFKLFLLKKLPSAYFSGVRVVHCNEEKAAVSVPFKWFSQNPFHSTYFACLAMAAEMSTGLLSMMHTYKSKPAISMLVTGLEASYAKKATGLTTFTCKDGAAIKQLAKESIQTGEARVFKATSVGVNEQGELIATFYITWSFKAKSK